MQIEKEKLVNKKSQISVPIERREYIAIYSTELKDTLVCECILSNEIEMARQAVCGFDEIELETLLHSKSDNASIELDQKLVKIRKLDRSVSERLKNIYEFKCQICGECIGEQYGTNFIHAHHIEPFSASLNNTPTNIMIICPNHHGIIHSTNPIYNALNKVFRYPNGYEEGLKINLHL